MGLILEYRKHVLKFNFEAGTSRGVLNDKQIWILKVYTANESGTYGLGEVSVIDRLSFDYNADFESELVELRQKLAIQSLPTGAEGINRLVVQLVPAQRPALRFALETALLDLWHGGDFKIFDNAFYRSESGLPINGLIWMGDRATMKDRIDEKLAQGFQCLKLKIGAIDFDAECDLLQYIRSKYPAEALTLRVDANGAFKTQEVLKVLDRLSAFDLHSIEQPIMPRQPEAMSLLCQKSVVPIALDEELIGIFGKAEKKQLLKEIQPQYIVLKPSLLGGFAATTEWIQLAESLRIGWWITSALESNIGLNAICQYAASLPYVGHQGLGTGQLYENNFHSPLVIQGDEILYNNTLHWDYAVLGF